MGIEQMRIREEELVKIVFEEMPKIPHLHILADKIEKRLGIISFYLDNIHFNLVVKILNDRFGIQVRGGCACAGTYGHFLLDVSHDQSRHITDLINFGDLSQKPGWIRLSLHPTMTNEELYYILDAIKQVQIYHQEWANDYRIILKRTNDYNAAPTDDGTKKHQRVGWRNARGRTEVQCGGGGEADDRGFPA